MRIQINARNRAYQFEAQADQRVLYAGLADGISLPYECASGTCGTCRAKLVSGEITDTWQEAPGRRFMRQPDEHLMCQCHPRSDCTFEVSSFVYATDPGACVPAFTRGIIRNLRRLTGDVACFDVELEAPCEYDAGQFMVMEVPGISGYRGYSMVNFERGARSLRFLVKKKPGGGVSEWLFADSVEGAEVDLYGPLGSAVFYPKLGKDLLLIGGGSGIAGMMSILARACQEHYFGQYEGHVFFGVRTFNDAFYLDELAACKRQFPEKLSVTVAFSDSDVPQTARDAYPEFTFEKGLVHEVAGRSMQGRTRNLRAYLAGPPPAVEAAIRVLLLEAKLTTDNIRYDKFS